MLFQVGKNYLGKTAVAFLKIFQLLKFNTIQIYQLGKF